MAEKQLIYAVDDEENIRELYRCALSNAGFAAECFEGGESLFAALKSKIPDLILLDVMLDGADGYEILASLKENAKTRDIPVVMVSARGEDMSKVKGLDLGADDYIAKPFGILELIARVKANLRKSRAHADTLRFGDIEVNDNLREISANGKILALTLKEYELLKLLVSYAPNVVKRDEILTAVWGEDYFGETRTLDIHTASLRKALAQAESGTKINTVRGVGYSLSFTREKA